MIEKPNGRTALLIAAGFFIALGAGWLASWFATGEQISWFRPADDAYYYYQVAENVATGHGFTMDRLNPTNGFHPLWLTVLVPVFAVVQSPLTTGIAVVQILLLLLIAVSAALIYQVAAARFSKITAVLCALAFAFPEYRNLGFTGVEAGLTLLILLLLARELVERPGQLSAKPRLADARLGCLLALAMLARLDQVFLLLTVAVLLTVLGLRDPSGGSLPTRVARLFRKGLAVYWPVLVLVVPYLAWNVVIYGHSVPISGVLKSSFPRPDLRLDLLVRHWEYIAILSVGVAGWLVALTGGREPDRLRAPVGLFATAGLAHLSYTLLFVDRGVFPWHYVSYLPPGLLGLGYLLEPVVQRMSSNMQRLAVAGTVSVLFVGVGASFAHRLPDGELAIESGTRLAAKDAAAWVRDNLPPDAILAMKDSGAFTFYSRRRVVNLDGVINTLEYQKRKCRGELGDYLAELDVRFLAQHRVSLDRIGEGYGEYDLVIPCLLAEGHDAVIHLQESDEIFRGVPYWSGSLYGSAVIWRLPATRRTPTLHGEPKS